MRDTRERRKNGIVRVYKHSTATERVREYRARCNEDFKREQTEKLKSYKKMIKKTILTHYGFGMCSCVHCGEKRIECLSIDHIKGDGRKHRFSINKQGHVLYVWLKNNNYPEGYQTLCMNCQWIKRFKNKEYNHLKGSVASVATVASVANISTVASCCLNVAYFGFLLLPLLNFWRVTG